MTRAALLVCGVLSSAPRLGAIDGLAPPTMGLSFFTCSGVFAAALWGGLAAVALANGWHPSRRSLQAGTA